MIRQMLGDRWHHHEEFDDSHDIDQKIPEQPTRLPLEYSESEEHDNERNDNSGKTLGYDVCNFCRRRFL